MQDLQGELLCAAANSGAIYLAARDDTKKTLLLLKTANNNSAPPATISATTWEVVTARPLDELWAFSYLFDCTVDEKGAFLLLSPYTTSTTETSDSKIRGAIYDPASGRPDKELTWQRNGAPDAIIPASDRLTMVKMPYVSDNVTEPGQLSTFMLDSRGLPTGQGSTFDLTTTNTDCRAIQWQTGSYYKGTLYYMCESIDTPQFSLYTFDGQAMVKTGTAAPLQDVNLLDAPFIPFPTSGGSAPTWAFRHDITNMYGIYISGPTAGQWHGTAGVPLRIDPNYKVVSYPNPLPSNSPSGDSDSSPGEAGGGGGKGVPVGAIVGIVAAFVVVAAAAFGIIYFRKRRRLRQEAEWKQRYYLGSYE
ncbi:hypothetical protein DFQ27_004357 [Actinomortierella ambigua]|uniref:Uncharacterized protein n=1 Tax=Actinomortierella ambigua TaxID=1343610 RepID=A0A9P6Q4U5_9FUNG|nr:hypothetical protein DFQ27_004357 [Actinomortierella ambigua]